MEKKEYISIHNASEHNLKNISVDIPVNEFTCVTGVSGCGKSSLVYDTIYAESQRNFLEGMSGNMYGQKLMDKPAVDSIENLRPALNVSQNYYNFNPRSTVGTLTDISHYLRALFALIVSFETKMQHSENYFSANNPSSCCKKCKGIGEEYAVSEKLVIPDPTKTLREGVILPYKGKEKSEEVQLLYAKASLFGIDLDTPFSKLKKTEIHNLLYKDEEDVFTLKYKTPKGRYKQNNVKSKGIIRELEDKLQHIDQASTFASISKYLTTQKCSCCNGTKLRKEVLEQRVCNFSIADVESMNMNSFCEWIEKVNSIYKDASISRQVNQLSEQMKKRASKMLELKVGYISLDRSIPTLSGGEVQRIRIANQLNCSLKGLIYILDEPCKGLHVRDIDSIIKATNELTENGNTVIAIEHNKKYITHANKIIELGPVGGPKGGYVISDNKPGSVYKYNINFRKPNRAKYFLSFKGITHNNIQDEDISIPLSAVTCVTGVSGSGKSSFLEVVEDSKSPLGDSCFRKAEGLSRISKIIKVNQQPIGKTPRSTVISYLEIYDVIRDLYAKTDEAKKLGLTASDFSMNVQGGRCECCQGTGYKRIELTYLPDSYVKCPDCHGKRFNDSVLSVKYNGLSITDVLDSSVDEVIDAFSDIPSVTQKLECMQKIGLGYIKLGQMSMTLSGGEAQRIKLAKALGGKSTGKNLYLLDEPTSGLNDTDIEKFVGIINELRDNNETLLIIEHNIEFVANVADHIIDFGNTAGKDGGKVMAVGSPKEVFASTDSSWYGVKKC